MPLVGETEFQACDLNDPAQVEAFYGSFGIAEHLRKSVLSSCRELVRAGAALNKIRLTEARVDDLARTHGNYLGFLTDCLEGRIARERNVRSSLQGGYR